MAKISSHIKKGENVKNRNRTVGNVGNVGNGFNFLQSYESYGPICKNAYLILITKMGIFEKMRSWTLNPNRQILPISIGI